MRCPTISALVCYLGRLALEKTSALAQKKYGCRIIYGDTGKPRCILPFLISSQSIFKDSVFLDFDPIDGPPTMSMEDLFLLAADAAKFLTDEIFRKVNPDTPMELEFEKVYSPLMMYAKKRYEGKEFSIDEYQTKLLREKHPDVSKTEREKMIVIGKPEHKAKGVITSRRDGVQVASLTYAAVISHILNGGDIDGFVKIIRMNVLQIQNDTYADYKIFSTTQSVKDNDSYVNPGSTASVVVAERLRERGIDVQPGSTVSYVYLDERDIQPLPASMQEYARKTPLKAHAAEDVDTAQQLKYRLDKSYYIGRIKSALSRFVGLCDPETQKQVNKIYADAIQLEKHLLEQHYNSSGEKRVYMADHTPWLNISEGLCPWQGSDEGDEPLGATCAASGYLKGLINNEIKLFKKDHGPRYLGSLAKWKIRCQTNCKQVYNGRAIIELQSQDPFCPIHGRIHQRTLRNPKSVPHRVRITSAGIGYICLKEGNTTRWPPLYKNGTSSAPIKNKKLKAVFQSVNSHLQTLKVAYENTHTVSNDAQKDIHKEDDSPREEAGNDQDPSVTVPASKKRKAISLDSNTGPNEQTASVKHRKILRMPMMPVKKTINVGIDMS